MEIIGYQGLYSVSSFGRIRNIRAGNILKPHIRKDGYAKVALTLNGDKETLYIHRIVANTFIPNPDGLPCVNHKNEIRHDNRVENLEWCEHLYNNNYGTRNRKISTSLYRKVVCTATKEVFESIIEASQKYNVSAGNIGSCCRGQRNYTGKHPMTGAKLTWEYFN